MFFRHDFFYHLGQMLLLGPKIYTNAREVLDTVIAEFDQALLLQVTVKILISGNQPKPADERLQNRNCSLGYAPLTGKWRRSLQPIVSFMCLELCNRF
jgi:hypothetical protein